MNISTSMMTSGMAQAASGPPPQRGGGGAVGGGEGPPSHASAIETLGSSLSDEIKSSLLTGAQELEESGASFEEIKAYIDGELEANGVDLSTERPRPGQLVDMMS